MTPIIIGAGRGRRLEHLTEEIPKPLVPIVGKPMLEHVLGALEAGGFSREEVVFVRGYLGEVIAERYPELTYVDNAGWPRSEQAPVGARGEHRGRFRGRMASSWKQRTLPAAAY